MTEHKPWLSLPDEDPPERGFAELMAAARVKAEVMANPPWWKRLFAVSRRPPVLALATVVVVVCGVLVVGRPREKAAPPAPAVDVPAGSLDTRARSTVAEPPPPPPVEEKLDVAVPKAGLKKMPDDPLAKCRAAAARRDCATAKACVKQAGRVDVGDDASLKSCL